MAGKQEDDRLSDYFPAFILEIDAAKIVIINRKKSHMDGLSLRGNSGNRVFPDGAVSPGFRTESDKCTT